MMIKEIIADLSTLSLNIYKSEALRFLPLASLSFIFLHLLLIQFF